MSDKEKQPETPVEPEKKDAELSDDELDNVAGGVVNRLPSSETVFIPMSL